MTQEFITFMGKRMDYDTLRNWVKYPYTLSDRETEAYRKFITDHGVNIDKTPFGWFFEVYWRRDCQLASSEVDSLLKTVDELEAIYIMFTCNDHLYMENHLRYMAKQLMDEEDRYEFFEVFRNQRTGKTTLISDEYFPEEEE